MWLVDLNDVVCYVVELEVFYSVEKRYRKVEGIYMLE